MLDVGGEQKPVRVFVSLTTDRDEDGGYREERDACAGDDEPFFDQSIYSSRYL